MIRERNDLRHFEPARAPTALRSLLLAGCLALCVGCGGEVNHENQKGETDMTETFAVDQVARTLEWRRAHLQATTDQERQEICKALIPHLQMRYSGLDCYAPQDQIRPHYMLFRLLMLEWSPVGYTIEDLKAVAGKPRNETDDSVTDSFDSGQLAWVYTFKGRPYIETIDFRDGQ